MAFADKIKTERAVCAHGGCVLLPRKQVYALNSLGAKRIQKHSHNFLRKPLALARSGNRHARNFAVSTVANAPFGQVIVLRFGLN